MPEENGIGRSPELRRLFPWTEIFRAFQIALDPSKMLLATAAALALWLGWAALGVVFGQESSYGTWPANVDRGKNPFDVVTLLKEDLFTKGFWLGSEHHAPPIQLEVFKNFFGPVVDLVRAGPGEAKWWYSLFGLLYTLAVWAIFGGAITRIAAVQIARREKIGLADALRFSQRKFASYFSAPLIPLAGIAGLAFLLLLGGLLLHVPIFGDLLVGLLFVKALIAGFIMAMLVIGYVGWPLMYATVSTEGTDSFDALSRCYAYVYQRPWHYVLYSLMALVYGVIAVFLTVFIASFAVHLVRWGLDLVPGLSWRGNALNALFVYAPVSYHWREMLTQQATVEGVRELAGQMVWYQTLGALLVGLWLNVLFLILIGFGYSFFWSAGTVIYFLLRKITDDTELDEVYLEDEENNMAFTAPAAESGTLAMPTASGPVAPPAPAAEAPKADAPPAT